MNRSQRESVTTRSTIKTKSDLFAKVTTTVQDEGVNKRQVVSGSYDMKGHAKNAWTVIANWGTIPWISFFKVSTPGMEVHQFTKDNFDIADELAHVCAQIARTSRSTRHLMDKSTH